jgi:signal transduction histidine kinase
MPEEAPRVRHYGTPAVTVRRALKMDDQIARILSLLSHELRSPLGVIRGYLGLLNQSGDTLSILHRDAVKAALRASDRAAEILTQASTLAQLQRSRDSIRLEPVAVDALFASAIEAVQRPAGRAVQIERGPIPPGLIRADAARLRDALTAIAAAVVRAQTRSDRILVTADLHERHNLPGVTLRIVSAAAGSSLTEAPVDLSRGGLGLDLPIADFVIAAHGGHLTELRDGDRAAGMVVWVPLTVTKSD